MEITNKNTHTKMMTGPVGALLIEALRMDPTQPETAPMPAARQTMLPSDFVHCLAAAAGVINIAIINTTPMLWIPITMAKTVSVISSKSSRLNR